MNNNILEDFKKVRVKHARLDDVYEDMRDICNVPNGEFVCVLVGATGIGKSKLVERIHADCIKINEATMMEDPGIIPSIMLKMPSPTPRTSGKSDFDWKDAFIRILESGEEVLLRKKVIPKISIELDGEIFNEVRGLVASELRRSIENLVLHRKVRQVILDEAGHIFVADAGKNYHLHFELLKSMAVAFQRPLILSGSFDLLKSTDLNGALARRIRVIHFQRYTQSDIDTSDNPYGESFRNAVHTLLERIPIPKEEGLLDNIDYFLMKCLGCIGLLKEWLERTLELALKQDEPKITRELLKLAELPNRRLKNILKEILLGESMLDDMKDEELAKALGLDVIPSLSRKSPKITDPSQSAKQGLKKQLAKNRRVGKRNPSRDPVEGMNNAN